MTVKKSARPGSLLASVAVGLLLLTGCAPSGPATTDSPATSNSPATSSGPANSSTAATAPPAAAPSAPATSTPEVPAAPATAQPPAIMAASLPVTLAIPAIGVRTELLHLGLRDNGSLEVPQDTGNGAPASWYKGSPTPGERGPSVMLGHVNALGGNTGVFAGLRELKSGDELNVSRSDGSVAVFSVYRGALYGKNSFPTLEVYGNTAGSELRLITCDGYDPSTGLFDDNYVVYAKLKA